MRCSQPMGLPTEALEFLKEHAEVVNPCEHCGRNNGRKTKTMYHTGMFNDVPVIKYLLKDGTWAEEFVQHCLWSSGPIEWFGLKLEDGTEFLWPEEVFKEEDY